MCKNKNQEPKILFFIRRYNDIDHIVPIVYRMAKDGALNIEILCLNPVLNISDDFRLRFIKRSCKVKIKYAYRALYPTFNHCLLALAIDTLRYRGRFPLQRLLSKISYRYLTEDDRFFGEKWAIALFRKKRPGVAVFDSQIPKIMPHKNKIKLFGKIPEKRRLKIYSSFYLIEAAKKLHIPTISVPHGLNLVTNKFARERKINKDEHEGEISSSRYFDYIIVPNKLQSDRDSSPQSIEQKGKITIMGSARYCREWEDVYETIYSFNSVVACKDSRKLKVVFMDNSYKSRANSQDVFDTINKISKLDFLDLILKPTTGVNGNLRDIDYKRSVSSPKLLENMRVAYNIPSLALIKWADVVICAKSSIIIEALMHNKILLYPKYFHENTMLFEEMQACWQVNSREELEEALRRIRLNPQDKPYSDTNVSKFITEVVYGGLKERDVLGNYKDFILSKASN